VSKRFQPLAISAAASWTAVGGAEQTATSVRAGLMRRREHPSYRATARDPEWDEDEMLVVCSVDGVPLELAGAERLLRLLVPTVADLCEAAELRRRDLAATALLVAMPAPHGCVAGWRLGDVLVPELCRRTGLGFATVRQLASGHTAVLELVAEAGALLGGGIEAALVVAVDSYLSPDRLQELDAAYRFKSRRNVDGFCPGEAAAAVLLESPRRARLRAAQPAAMIDAVGVGREPQPWLGSDRVSTGAGLSEALRGALGTERAGWALCDLNGESYRAFEWGVALTRLGEELAGLARVVMPVATLGDVGAATGGVLLATALEAYRRRWSPAKRALLWTASDGAERAAARIAGEI
jgi:3-oxoacyl-[acyl-carrier-protein] synthase I